jgi:hypothetical protein
MGVGEGIGSDGPGGRGRKEEEREWRGKRGSAYWWVLVLVLSEQTTAWFSLSFWVFWMGVVWFTRALSLSSDGEWNGTGLLPNYMQGQADLLTCGLFILSPPADSSSSVLLTHFHPLASLSVSLSSPFLSHQ